MAFTDLLVTEVFHSLQGETSLSGVPFAFVRLTGCNLRCTYCDSAYSFKNGTRRSITQILDTISNFKVRHVLITGGEPMMQRQTPALALQLAQAGYHVSIETHGEVSVAPIQGRARIIMDIKTPSSGMARLGYRDNLKYLRPDDEIKFVIASEADYLWAKTIIEGGLPTREVLLSPAVPAKDSPGSFPGVSARWLANKILEDRLPVRLQLQLHKLLWGADQRGV